MLVQTKALRCSSFEIVIITVSVEMINFKLEALIAAAVFCLKCM